MSFLKIPEKIFQDCLKKQLFEIFQKNIYHKIFETNEGVPIFCVLAANSLWAGNLTGSSMNPANEIFTVLMLSGAENGSKIWIYIVGPFGGAIIGALFYRFVLRQENLPPGQNRTFEIERISQPPSRTPLLSQSPV